MAFTKQRKSEICVEYEGWLSKSQAVFMLEYGKMGMKEVDALRAKMREAGGELHVVKNTLFGLALENGGYQKSSVLEKTTIVGFAFGDAAAFAKALTEATVKSEVFKVKGGYLGKTTISGAEVKSLAELPPLPVMRARLLGVLQAPAAQLVRTLAEPSRSLACVVKAYSEKDAAPAAEPVAE